MCFVPKVSLATALLEFGVALWLYLKFPQKTIKIFFVLILFLLGLYQLTEFMLCVFDQEEIWGKLGFITYTLIPAVTLYFSLVLIQKKANLWLILFWPLYFIAYAILDTNFVLQGTCSTLFVTVRNKFSFPDSRLLPFSIYSLYYYSYLAMSTAAIIWGALKSPTKKEKNIFWLMFISILLTLFPPLFLIVIFPSLGIKFPSVYCQFAMILTIVAIVGIYLENKTK